MLTILFNVWKIVEWIPSKFVNTEYRSSESIWRVRVDDDSGIYWWLFFLKQFFCSEKKQKKQIFYLRTNLNRNIFTSGGSISFILNIERSGELGMKASKIKIDFVFQSMRDVTIGSNGRMFFLWAHFCHVSLSLFLFECFEKTQDICCLNIGRSWKETKISYV